MNKPIFLISTGRTGTKFFSEFFKDYIPNVSSYHTTKYTEIINIIGNIYSQGLLPRFLAKLAWRLLKHKSVAYSSNRYMECNPYYVGILDIILEDFPKAKVIILVRSPREYILSHIKKENENLKSRIANGLIPFWQPISFWAQLKNLSGNQRHKVNYYAKIWQAKNKKLLELQEVNNNIRIFKFEDIFSQGKGIIILKQMLNWLELEPDKEIDKSIFERKINPTLSDASIKWHNNYDKIIKTICAELMYKFGYHN